jgi:hypothetical protein
MIPIGCSCCCRCLEASFITLLLLLLLLLDLLLQPLQLLLRGCQRLLQGHVGCRQLAVHSQHALQLPFCVHHVGMLHHYRLARCLQALHLLLQLVQEGCAVVQGTLVALQLAAQLAILLQYSLRYNRGAWGGSVCSLV